MGHFSIYVLLPIDRPAAEVANFLRLGFDAGHAVIFFYVISGFLISYALENKYRENTRAFYQSRFMRIFPLYWFIYGLMFLFDYGGSLVPILNGTLLAWVAGVLLFAGAWP